MNTQFGKYDVEELELYDADVIKEVVGYLECDPDITESESKAIELLEEMVHDFMFKTHLTERHRTLLNTLLSCIDTILT